MITSMFFEDTFSTEGKGWSFNEIHFEAINLMVGASGSGKTRFINALFNIGICAAGGPIRTGHWIITFTKDDLSYVWDFIGKKDSNGLAYVSSETIKSFKKGGSEYKILIKREEQNIEFNGHKLPKLAKDKSSISLLKDEETIMPVFFTFQSMMKRSFHIESQSETMLHDSISVKLVESLVASKSLESLILQQMSINTKMYLLHEAFPEIYNKAVAVFKSIFPSIESCRAKAHSDKYSMTQITPVFSIKEKNVDEWINLSELSSGMQKVILIISDIMSLPENSIYIIDEYENSLGVNAINFLPELLFEYADKIQFFITTHHPYLINNMDISTWKIFHRDGSHVTIKSGKEFKEKYKKSNQESFIKLLNDPFYKEGIL